MEAEERCIEWKLGMLRLGFFEFITDHGDGNLITD